MLQGASWGKPRSTGARGHACQLEQLPGRPLLDSPARSRTGRLHSGPPRQGDAGARARQPPWTARRSRPHTHATRDAKPAGGEPKSLLRDLRPRSECRARGAARSPPVPGPSAPSPGRGALRGACTLPVRRPGRARHDRCVHRRGWNPDRKMDLATRPQVRVRPPSAAPTVTSARPGQATRLWPDAWSLAAALCPGLRAHSAGARGSGLRHLEWGGGVAAAVGSRRGQFCRRCCMQLLRAGRSGGGEWACVTAEAGTQMRKFEKSAIFLKRKK